LLHVVECAVANIVGPQTGATSSGLINLLGNLSVMA
jgi:hypothetical protein